MVKGILSFVSPRCLCDRTISLTDETAKKYTQNDSEPSESMKMYIGKVSELSESMKMFIGKISELSESRKYSLGRCRNFPKAQNIPWEGVGTFRKQKKVLGQGVGTFRTLCPGVYPQGKRSEKKAFGNGRPLYRMAITSPYAPAERNAIRSLRRTSFSSTSLPNTSDDSQTGPTTS